MPLISTFSLPSGFLLAYAFFEKQKKKPSNQLTIDVLKGIVYRYIRIAPCFMIVSKKNVFSWLSQLTKIVFLFLADVFCDHAINIYEWHFAVCQHWKHWGELQKILVAESSLHSKPLPFARDVHELELVSMTHRKTLQIDFQRNLLKVCCRRFSTVYLVEYFAGDFCEVSKANIGF